MRDLHLHLDGSVRQETIYEFLQKEDPSIGDFSKVKDMMMASENIERVTINTDNMTVSNTNLQKERNLAKEVLGFSGKDLETSFLEYRSMSSKRFSKVIFSNEKHFCLEPK